MSEPISFFKGHGLGNDYLVLDPGKRAWELGPLAIRLLCDRHLGVGSDGVLVPVPSERAAWGVRIFNPDGSEAEKSGNGLRVFAAYLRATGQEADGARFTVATLGGLVTIELHGESSEGVLMVTVEMGRASFRSSEAGMRGPDRLVDGEVLELEAGDRVAINTVSLGNPHCVVFEDWEDPEQLARRAPQISTHPEFTRGINVQFARVVGAATLEAWVWERGAGPTLASGSSACAVAAAAVRRGLVSEREIDVRMPGGTLHVTVGDNWEMVLRGPVEGVYTGELTPGMLRRLLDL